MKANCCSLIARQPTRACIIQCLCLAAAFVSLTYVPLLRGHAASPNVVIFFTDDQGTLDANCYGSTDLYTPTMDELAATGVRFTQAYAHTVCCPARALLITGRHPQRSSVNHWTQGDPRERKGINMLREEVTLAEMLRIAGYKTALFGKWHLGAHLDYGPTEQGFDEFFGIRGGFIDNYRHHFLHGQGYHDLYDGKQEVFADGEYFPDLIIDKALVFLEQNRDHPFFMYVAFNIPHYPEQADSRFDDRYQHLRMPRQSYARMISTTDHRMGIVVKKLDDLEIRDNTIIICMSDNGHSEENGGVIKVEKHSSGYPKGHYYSAHGGGGNTGKWRGHKGTLFEGGIRVPAIISYPAALPQEVVRGQAITAADWLPTVAELCGVTLPKVKLDGQSLLPIIRSAHAPTHHKVMHWQWNVQWAVRQGPWKLIGLKDRKRWLGNLDDEKPEAKNYLQQTPDVAKRLHELHDEWVAEVTGRGSSRFERRPGMASGELPVTE